jgi:hypothetical protein
MLILPSLKGGGSGSILTAMMVSTAKFGGNIYSTTTSLLPPCLMLKERAVFSIFGVLADVEALGYPIAGLSSASWDVFAEADTTQWIIPSVSDSSLLLQLCRPLLLAQRIGNHFCAALALTLTRSYDFAFRLHRRRRHGDQSSYFDRGT